MGVNNGHPYIEIRQLYIVGLKKTKHEIIFKQGGHHVYALIQKEDPNNKRSLHTCTHGQHIYETGMLRDSYALHSWTEHGKVFTCMCIYVLRTEREFHMSMRV